MSHEIIDRDGVREVVDVTPVEEFERNLRESIQQRIYFKRSAEQIAALKKMDREQLLRVACILTFMVEEYAHLYDRSFSPDHEKMVAGLRGVKQAADEAGVELWKNWPELGENK